MSELIEGEAEQNRLSKSNCQNQLKKEKACECHNYSNNFSKMKEFPRKKNRVIRSHLVVEVSLARLNLSPAKTRPLIRKSKLKFLGSQVYEEFKLIDKGNASKIETIINRKKSTLPDQSDITFTTSNPSFDNEGILNKIKVMPCDQKPIFKRTKDHLMQDFKSLSLKDKFLFGHSTSEICSQLKFTSLGLDHRGNCRPEKIRKKSLKRLSDSELPDLKSLSISENDFHDIKLTCAEAARNYEDITTDELAAYLDNYLHFPKKMSLMAEMMYT